MNGKPNAHHARPITGTQISSCLRKNFSGRMRRLSTYCSDHDVDPALVVAGHQIRVLVVQPFQAFEVPAGAPHQVHPRLVVADPGFVGVVHQPFAEAFGERQRLEQRDDEQERTQQDRVQRQQQRRDYPAHGGR